MGQVRLANHLLAGSEEPKISNLVFMGMGEPLANMNALEDAILIMCDRKGLALSPGKVTVSTIGLISKFPRLAELKVNLAISLNAPRRSCGL